MTFYSAFQWNAFQNNAFQIANSNAGGTTGDTHDLPDAQRYRKKLQKLANARSEFEASKLTPEIKVVEKTKAVYKEQDDLAILMLLSW